MRRLLSFVAAATLVFSCLPSSALADEGMWTFDNFPSAKVKQAYGFAPSRQWLDHVRLASLRAPGCSASFVSPDGLVMTNHHCVVNCLAQLSTAQKNYAENGYYAQRREDEIRCPNFELYQLAGISDVTKTVQGAIAGKTGAAANAALREVTLREEQSCGSDPSVRCQVVPLYHGGIYDLYRYKRYDDVRLAFAPEFSVAQFGGDPDNFNFPRFDYDMSLVRAYENGKPAASPDYFSWSANGSTIGELVFVPGNPGGTSRELTTAELAYERDYALPAAVAQSEELRGILEEFMRRGAEQRREANERLFLLENGIKVQRGRRLALVDPAFFGTKVRDEKKLRAAVAAKPALRQYASAWTEIERLQPLRQSIARRAAAATAATPGLLGIAVTLVRAADERTKPNAQRLPEFTDLNLPRLQRALLTPAPHYPDLDEIDLAFRLSKLRETLGTDDPLVKAFLGTASPDELAHRLVSETKLGDPAVRKSLYDGGKDAIAASTDPMIVMARNLDPQLRALRKDVEDRITAPSRAAAERIAKARFAVYGTKLDPDATFTLRLSYGTVKGFPNESNVEVPPYTTIGGLFERATGADPYVLPKSWLDAKSSLNLSTPMNLTTTNDIIGGNSGSPLIDQRGQIVGLAFDGNIYSLGGDYGYDPVRNRMIAVDSRAMLEALTKVYHADRLVAEITAARSR
ncbi:MAG: S46 family peptidase [Candidatus Eremiobacteraeota bacterium]|nr:S46 family peptidase [Candidatus Eremiobacteraeota bacterium]